MSRTSAKISFPGGNGQSLSGILDLPAGEPGLAGVFAPCFTCVKESHGAVKICRALADRGVAMLRFDSSGVGESAGDFRAQNFTSRVADMVAAAAEMVRRGMEPRLLVGHSVGGTSALSAARHVPSAQVVATIGSPADPQRMIENFRKHNLMSEKDGALEINVLGRKLPFHPSFVEDMLMQDVAAETAALAQKLLVFHAPHDDIVGIGNAAIIAGRARNAEVVELDAAATHLFEKRDDDAVFIAETLLRALRNDS